MADSDTAEPEVRQLYHDLIAAWNHRSAHDMAALTEDAVSMIGFDGSQMDGRDEVERQLAGVFASHQTGRYVTRIREVRFPSADVAVLRAVSGMIPFGQTDVNPKVNAIQTLVAVRTSGRWLITLFQNTPAAFDGRPELGQQLTAELREVFRAEGV